MEYLKQLVEFYQSTKYHGCITLINRNTSTFHTLDSGMISIEGNGNVLVEEPVAVVEVLLPAYLIPEDMVWRYNRLIDGYQLSISMNGADVLSIHDFNNKLFRYKATIRNGSDIVEFLKQPWRTHDN